MTRRDAHRLANQMIRLRPEVIQRSMYPKWDRYTVEYSDVLVATDHKNKVVEYIEYRRRL